MAAKSVWIGHQTDLGSGRFNISAREAPWALGGWVLFERALHMCHNMYVGVRDFCLKRPSLLAARAAGIYMTDRLASLLGSR
jgi:hypothetical protein